MQSNWEQEIAELLTELSAVQTELLEFLGEMRKRLADVDIDGMNELQSRERELLERLQQCHSRRGQLLERAAAGGLPGESIRALASALPDAERQSLAPQVQQASLQARLLQHHSLTNWVLAQRTLLHLGQILEIIASGGRLQPTYGKESSDQNAGVLLDQAG